MNATMKSFSPLGALAALAHAAIGVAVAAEVDEVTELSKPESEVSVGFGYVSEDNQRFGQYTGLDEQAGYGLLDLDFVRRNEETGTWLTFTGRNLGLDNRELRFEHNRQGDWGYFIDFSQTPRFEPYTVTTTLAGVGTTTQTIAGSATPQEYHLKTERNALTAGFNKDFSRTLGLQVRVRNEEKDGERLWGQGHFGTWRFLTDPINQTTRQMDALFNYATERLQLSGGYYGTWFENRNDVLTVVGATIFAGSDQMALPPDNQSHQLHLAGGYSFTNTARATFKLAYGRITQDETFATTPVAGAPNSLDGRVDTTLVQAGLTARPLPKLSVRADARYENRDDKTTVFRYYFPSQNTAGATNDGTNETRDIATTTGKLEATYRLPAYLSLTGGVEYVQKKRNSPPVRSVDFREETDEKTIRLELRRPISETLTGGLGVLHSERGGSEWLVNTGNMVTTSTGDLIAPLHLADRDRNTLRLTANWMPFEPLSFNFRADVSRDEYTGRELVPFELGPREGAGQNYSLDAAYVFTDAVQGNVWAQRNVNSYENALCQSAAVPNANTCNATSTNPVWSTDLRNFANTVGLGLRAKLTEKLELVADAMRSRIRDEMRLTSISPTPSVVDTGTGAPLDDIHTTVTTFRLSAKYALWRNAGVTMMYMYDRYETDDWTWANWNYSLPDGGTTVRQEPLQKVHFFGVSGYYRWW